MDKTSELCPVCEVEHEVVIALGMRILACPRCPPGQLWAIDRRYIQKVVTADGS